MKTAMRAATLMVAIAFAAGMAQAAGTNYAETISLFKNAGQSAEFFDKSYGYAVFPTIGKGGFGVGAAHGRGRVYVHGAVIGDTTMNQLSVGFQAGGEAYSEIIFFEDRRALEAFTNGNYEFDAGVGAVAITAGASATAGTAGSGTGVSGGKKDARTTGSYTRGMAVFTIAKGGLMFDATVAGQKFSYKPREGHG
jgi:lipid-binding SYLF domain-containing protein